MTEPTGLLLDAKHFAVHDGPGIRTAYYFKGCSLHCLWCHNPESIAGLPQLGFFAHKCRNCGSCVPVCPYGAHRMEQGIHAVDRALCRNCGVCVSACPAGALKLYGRRMTVDEVVQDAVMDRDFYENTNGGVTLSGGEPLMQPEFALALLAALKKNGLHTALDTCLAVPEESVRATLPVTDMYLVDFKHADSDAHKRLTGQGNERIIANLRMLSEAGARIEVRIPLVPGCNADDANMAATGRILRTMKIEQVRLLAYHDLARSKYRAVNRPDTMPQTAPPGEAMLKHCGEILRHAADGLDVSPSGF